MIPPVQTLGLQRLGLESCTGVSGDVAALATLISLTTLDLSYTKVSGDVAVSATLTSLTEIKRDRETERGGGTERQRDR